MFHWSCADAEGQTLGEADIALFTDAWDEQPFDSRETAENWLREAYADLADAGAVNVTLYEGDAPVYTMSLEG